MEYRDRRRNLPQNQNIVGDVKKGHLHWEERVNRSHDSRRPKLSHIYNPKGQKEASRPKRRWEDQDLRNIEMSFYRPILKSE
jgi:hypothetical protein